MEKNQIKFFKSNTKLSTLEASDLQVRVDSLNYIHQVMYSFNPTQVTLVNSYKYTILNFLR